MFPRGIPSAALPDAVTSALRTCSSRASRKLGSFSLASSGHPMPHGQPGGGTRPPRFRSASPPSGSPPTALPKMLRTPACGIVFRASHHASGPPKFPSRCSGNCASGASCVSSTSHARAATSGRYGVKCCPRHSRRFRTPIVVCATWSFLRDHLTPRPAVAKSTYRFCVRKIRYAPALQNTHGNRRGREVPPIPRVPGEVGWASMVQAVIRKRRGSWLQRAICINPSHPPPLAAAARGVAK